MTFFLFAVVMNSMVVYCIILHSTHIIIKRKNHIKSLGYSDLFFIIFVRFFGNACRHYCICKMNLVKLTFNAHMKKFEAAKYYDLLPCKH